MDGTQWFSEILIGTVNGTNKVFTTSQPFVGGSTLVYINGLLQIRDVHYTETQAENKITLSDAPSNVGFTDVLQITYAL